MRGHSGSILFLFSSFDTLMCVCIYCVQVCRQISVCLWCRSRMIFIFWKWIFDEENIDYMKLFICFAIVYENWTKFFVVQVVNLSVSFYVNSWACIFVGQRNKKVILILFYCVNRFHQNVNIIYSSIALWLNCTVSIQ